MTNNITLKKITEGLNEAQSQAVSNPLNSCTKIVAGAGTGKTKIISKRFLKLVLDLIEQNEEKPQSKILVITFTDKAANEMKERIVKELEQNNIEIGDVNSLWISTFHSFCIRILKKYSIEAGLSPSFKMAEEKQLKDIYDNIIKHIKYAEASNIENFSEILNNSNIEPEILSVEEISKLSSIADLDTLFENIYLTIKKIKSLGIDSKEFLETSITAVQKFSNTVETTPFKFDTKEDYAFAWREHFKKYCDDGLIFDENIFDAIAKEKLILDKNGKRKASEYGMAKGFPENTKPICEIEIQLIKTIASIYALYQAELERQDLADFDDLINKTIQIFKHNELIRSYYQEYFKQIIVDEFQDTNGAQLELIELLLNPKYPNLTFVGDRKQSIYAFRYAQMENLEVLHQNVEKRYNQKFAPVNLSINYRSTPEVLNAVNFVTEKELGLKNENLTANPNLTYPDTSKDIKVTIIDEFENAYEQRIKEAQYISSEIETLLKRDNADYKDFAILVKSHAQADVIEKELRKKNIPSLKKVNTGFFKEPVIKNVIAALKLLKNPEDELAFFRLMKANLSDSEIYNLKKDAEKILKETMDNDEIKKLNLVQKFSSSKEKNPHNNSKASKYAEHIIDTVSSIQKNKISMTLLEVFEKIKNSLVLCSAVSDFEIQKAKNNLKILEKIIDDYIQNGNFVSVNNLLDYLEKISDDRNFELPSIETEDINAVQILTIHASKGLEFPYVFILSIASSSKTADKSNIIFDMQYGGKPGFGIVVNKYNGNSNPKALIYKQLWQKPREQQEALRLFYVAVSRAKKYLNVLSFEPYGTVKPVDYITNFSGFLKI